MYDTLRGLYSEQYSSVYVGTLRDLKGNLLDCYTLRSVKAYMSCLRNL